MKKLTTLVLFFLLSTLGGCLEFDAQDVYLRYDPELDRIDALFVYRGMFAEGGNGSTSNPVDKALKDLDEARLTGEFTFWSNWPLSCNPSRDYDVARDALVKHLEVENGDLFTDPQGRLCGYQFVRVNQAKAFVKKLNTLLGVAMQAEVSGISKRLGHKFDEETAENVRDFLRTRGEFVSVEQGRIELRLPLSAKDHAWLKDNLEERFLEECPRDILRRIAVDERRKAGGSKTDTAFDPAAVTVPGAELRERMKQAATLRFFFDNDFSFAREETQTTLGIGVAGADELRVRRAPLGVYDDTLLKALRDRGDKIEDGLPDQELMRRFEQFRGRAPKLPESLAARRR